MMAQRWLLRPRSDAQTSVRLFCLPPAGGAASFYRDWGDALPPGVEVCPVQLPGRETRLRERPYTRLDPLLEGLVGALAPYLDRPFAIFGHSMGALVGFELARRLRAGAAPEPLLLVVSGHSAPHLPLGHAPLHALPTAQLVEAVRDLNGTPEEVLGNSELRELVLPAIRADFEVCETYVHQPHPPLSCRVVAFGGTGDPLVSRTQLAGWRQHTNGPFAMTMLPGDHFFRGRSRRVLLARLARELAALFGLPLVRPLNGSPA